MPQPLATAHTTTVASPSHCRPTIIIYSLATIYCHHHCLRWPPLPPIATTTVIAIFFSLFFVVQVSLECKSLFLACGFLWFGFSLMGRGAFVLIFALFLFWLEIDGKSCYSNLAFWEKWPEEQALNHCKFMYKFVNHVFFFLLHFSIVCRFWIFLLLVLWFS